MTHKSSKRAASIKPSPTLAVTARSQELRREGVDVIGLGAGEPDFDTPEHIRDAAKAAIDAGHTRYTPADGMPELKKAIQAKLRRDNGLEFELSQIMASCGAKHSLYNLFQALLDPGDEVVIPAPYWVSYPDMAKLAGAQPVIVSAGPETRFKITPDQLAGAITDKTRLLVVNSPSNPTGTAYTRNEWRALAQVLADYPNVVVVTDDIYEFIYWGDETCDSFATACPDFSDRTVVVNGVSKAYAMTGWRIGYAAGPADIIKAMKKIQGQSTSNPAAVSQMAAVAALNGDHAPVREMVKAFRERHDFVVEKLNALPGVSCLAGDGTFYAFPDMSKLIEKLPGIDDDSALARFLLEEARIALVPGSAFGAPGFVRISFAASLETLREALDRIAVAVGERLGATA